MLSSFLLAILAITSLSFSQDWNVTQIASRDYWDAQAGTITVLNDLIAVNANNDGIYFLRSHDGNTLEVLGSFDSPGSGMSLKYLILDSNYAYVIYYDFDEHRDQLLILDITNPRSPVFVSMTMMEQGRLDGGSIAKFGNFLIIPRLYAGSVDFVDVSNPLAPYRYCQAEVDSAEGNSVAVRPEDSTLFIDCVTGWPYQDYIAAFDISSPCTPIFLDLELVSSHMHNIIVQDSILIYTQDNNWGILDIGNPQEMSVLSSNESDEIGGILLDEHRIYLNRNTNVESDTMEIWDISNPALPVLLSQHANWWTPGMKAFDGFVLKSMPLGLDLLDLTDAAAPQLAHRLITGREVVEYHRIGNYAVSIGSNTTLLSLNPPMDFETILCPHSLSGPATIVFRDTLGMSAGYHSVVFFDWSDPTNPERLSEVELIVDDTARIFSSVGSMSESLAFAQTFDYQRNLTAIIDISDPTAPTIASWIDLTPHLSRYTRIAYFHDEHLIVCDFSTLAVFSIANLAAPEFVTTYDMIGDTRVADFENGYLYTNGYGNHYSIYDLNDPVHPQLVASSGFPDGYSGIDVVDGFMYVSGNDRTLKIYNVSDPAHPIFVGEYETPRATPVGSLPLEDGQLLLSTSDKIELLDISQALPTGRVEESLVTEFSFSAYPNPFNSTLSISLTLPAHEQVEIMLYNLLGREVEMIHRGRLDNATLSYTAPPTLASGIYFLRAATVTQTQMQKVVLLK